MEFRTPVRKLVAIAASIALGAGTIAYIVLRPATDGTGESQASDNERAVDPGLVSEAQMARLGIRLEPAKDAGAMPLATVPATVTLPPEARVAVTSPFAGTVLRVFVIPGQDVSRGDPLAVVRAADAVRFGAELARAEADLAFTRASADRLEQLAREGVVAGVRADEARAAARRTEATIRENRRLLGLAGAAPDGTMTLRAPIAGRVSTVAVETGGAIAEGVAPFVVENTASLRLDLQLPARLAGQVRPGMTVVVALPGETAKGQILSVGAQLDPATNSVHAKATVAGANGLIPGKGVMAVVNGDPAGSERGIAVPAKAVVRIAGQDFVFVRTGKRFERRAVAVAAEAAGSAVLSGGVRPGERVAVSGVAELKSLLAGQ